MPTIDTDQVLHICNLDVYLYWMATSKFNTKRIV